MDQQNKLRIKEPEAANFTGCSKAYLRLKRMAGQEGGPPFIKIGRSVVYDTRDLESWLAQHKVGGERC